MAPNSVTESDTNLKIEAAKLLQTKQILFCLVKFKDRNCGVLSSVLVLFLRNIVTDLFLSNLRN